MKLSIIGAGHMGGAILRAALSQRLVSPENLFVCDAAPGCAEALAQELGIQTGSVAEVVAQADVVLLAVRPGDLASVLQEIPEALRTAPLFLSIAAGRKLSFLEKHLPGARIVRIMPNLGVMAGQGMCVYSPGKNATEEDLKTTHLLLSAMGKACCLPEKHMDAVTALSGSGPAFFAYALHAMIESGKALGIPAESASQLALQTMLGTATLLAGENAPAVGPFIQSVATKGGTTAAGMVILESSDVLPVYAQTLRAAAARSAEISNDAT